MALVAALTAMAVGASTAAAGPNDCGQNGCVVLVEVDGLEPGDVTQAGTPFLWALAHPAGTAEDPTGTAYDNLLADRNGFMWQAARAPMTASTATSAASLLTGSNPDQHGILADEFEAPLGPSKTPARVRLRPTEDQDAGGGLATPVSTGASSTLLELAVNSSVADAPEAWAFIGNPALAVMLDDQLQLDGVTAWSPTAQSGSDPALCPLPRAVPGVGAGTGGEVEGLSERACPSRDATTLQQAFTTFSEDPEGKTPVFAYIHLAELGRMKQLHGDAEVPATLENLDAALAAFVSGLANHPETSGAWQRTVLVVTGNHGYESTPVDRRVPHPDHVGATDWDFSDFLESALPTDKPTRLVPQGTVATVYSPKATAADVTALAALIEDKGDEACQELAQEDCIAEVAPVATLAELHRTWALNPLTEDGKPTGAGGQLVVTLEEGWAFGRATQRSDDPLTPPADDADEATNPYPGSAGGPRNRAIALVMSGPDESGPLLHTIGQGPRGGLAAMSAPQTPPRCTGSPKTADLANDPDTMADDAAAPGHECQAETVDVALSIAGMLELDTESVPVAPHARFLNEAFTPDLGEQEEVEEPQPELIQPAPPPPPEPIVIVRGSVQVITPPPPKDPFPYRGLIRRLRTRVTDARGKPFALAQRGATLSTIEVQADFGKPESLVTLTFYRRARGSRRSRLSAIARFKPFTVKRGPVRLRLRIPKRFRPTHLGVSVQQVETVEGQTRTVGKPGGGIAQIADARRLHLRKGATRRLRG
ncbi:MAG TPA: alkaline phosphatase family protein [Solirubrobacteraceae bacterium]|nr:alkaline phosphatase family protein [Solirubrobacteraceae bacterium]